MKILAVCWLMAASGWSAQTDAPAIPAGLLPTRASVIEVADLTPLVKRDRMLVLWMEHPESSLRSDWCGDAVYGDSWVGPARVSLIDRRRRKILNTIAVEGDETAGIPRGQFRIPFLLGPSFYHVPQRDSAGEGKPVLLHLVDLTGDGLAVEFVLFQYVACGLVDTAVFGYQSGSDRVLRYPVELIEDGQKPQLRSWVLQLFAHRQASPGRWDFRWGPGHGEEGFTFHEVAWFDRARQRFVTRRARIVGH